MQHIGDLYKDSPGLAALLEGSYPQSEIEEFLILYNLTCKYGALNEGDIKRIEGASYNPRPARIVQIIYTEGSIKEIQVLKTALISCAEETILDQDIDLIRSYRSDYQDIRSILSGHSANNLVSPIISIVFSHLLDQLRHLHMCQFTPIIYKEHLVKLKNIYDLINLNSNNQKELPNRLRTFIEAAFSRAEKRIENNE